MRNPKDWNLYKSLQPKAATAWKIAKANPRAAGLGLLAGATWGVATSNEGRGPISNTLFWAPVGAAVGIGILGAAPHVRAAAGQARQMNDFIRRAPRSWKGMAANSPEVMEYARSAKAAAATNPGMSRLAGMYDDFIGTPDSYLYRRPKMTNEQLSNQAFDFLRGQFGMGGQGPLTAADLHVASPEVPEWMKTAMSYAHDAGSSKSPRVGNRLMAGEEFLTHTAKWDWKMIVENIMNHGDDAKFRGEFLSDLNMKMSQYSKSWYGGVSATDIGMPGTRQVDDLEFGARTTMRMLRNQGQKRIARWVSVLQAKHGDGITIKGIMNDEIAKGQKSITGLMVQFGEAKDGLTIQVDVPNAQGIIRHGRFGQNIHIPRSANDIRSIKAVTSGRATRHGVLRVDPTLLKPRAQDPASFVLSNLVQTRPETLRERLGWLERTYTRLTAWEPSPYRSDRAGLDSAFALEAIEAGRTPISMIARQNSMSFVTPTDEFGRPISALEKEMGIGDLVDHMGSLKGTTVPDWYHQWGFMTTGSENQARNLTFNNVFKMLEYDPGAIKNPLSKNAIFERDVAKPYRLGFNETMGEEAVEAARKVAWKPFGTAAARRDIGAYEEGFMMALHPVFESEIALADKLAFARNRKVVNRVFRSAGIEKSKWDLLYRNLGKIAEVNEGTIASATPAALEVANSRLIEMDLINQSLLAPGQSHKDLVGMVLGTEDYMGLDVHTGERIGHTFSEASQGRAIIRQIQTRIDPKTNKSKIFARIEERYPGAEGKIGHAAAKTYMKNIEAEAVPVFGQLIDWLRSRKGRMGHAQMYRNQPILPVFKAISTRGQAVTAFALQSTIVKHQNEFSVLFNNLLVKHMSNMTPLGQNKMMSMLKAGGVDVLRVRDGQYFEATAEGVDLISGMLKPAERMGRAEAYYKKLGPDKGGLLHNIYTEIYRNPSKYFRKGYSPQQAIMAGAAGATGRRAGVVARGIRNINMKHIKAIEMMSGIVAPAKLWDTLESNIPGQASITMHEMQSLQQYGLNKTYGELMGRAGRSGSFSTTRAFYGGLAELADNSGYITDKAAEHIGLNRFTLDDVSTISKVDPSMKYRQIAEDKPWRQLGQFEENFLVDLKTAHSSMREAEHAVGKALGVNRVLVPGTKSDLWGVEYVTENGKRISTESFVEPLEKMLKSISQHYGNPMVKQHLIDAARYHEQYLSAISDVSKGLYTGRGGSIKDISGLWASGRATFRPYRSIYRKELGEMASHVVGVSPKKFSQLTQNMMRETGLSSMEELVAAGHMIDRGGKQFMLGNSIRYPVTDAGPVLLTADESLKRGGIGMEETFRYIKNADFDGDSLVARAFMEKGTVAELLGALSDPNSQAFKKYHEALRISDIFGGVGQDTRRIAMGQGEVESLFHKMIERQSKFKFLAEQSVMERTGKMLTTHIGRYSNLSKTLTFMTDMPGLSDTERLMRMRIGNELEQMSIDFGRQATAAGSKAINPTQISDDIGKAWHLATTSPASTSGGANQMLRGVFEDLDFVNKFSKTILKNGGTQEDVNMLRQLTENWWSTGDGQGGIKDFDREMLAKRGEFFDSLAKRGLRRDEVHAALGEFLGDQGVRSWAGESGLLNIPGHMPKAGNMLSEINQLSKGAVAGSFRIIKGAWDKFARTPEGRAAGTILAGAGLLAAGIGLTSSPTEMDEPDYPTSKAGAAIMRSPDVGMNMAGGDAPLPGSRGGHTASSLAPESMPRYTKGVHAQHKRFYYDQSNRTPRTTSYAATTPEQAAFMASEAGADMARYGGGGSNNMNVVNSPSARRYSKHEMQSRVREDLYR